MYWNITAPKSAPTNISYLADRATRTSLAFSFRILPCGSRGGDISYDAKVTILQEELDEQKEEEVEEEEVEEEDSLLEDNINAIFNYTFNNDSGIVSVSGLQSDILYGLRLRGISGNGTLPGPYGKLNSGRTSAVPGKTQSLLFMILQYDLPISWF